jgi:hypothetical protein
MDWSQMPWGTLGPAGVLVIAVLMILRGDIVARRTLDDVRSDRDARLKEKQAEIDALYRQVEALQSTTTEQATQVTTLLEVAQTARHVLLSLPKAGGDG